MRGPYFLGAAGLVIIFLLSFRLPAVAAKVPVAAAGVSTAP